MARLRWETDRLEDLFNLAQERDVDLRWVKNDGVYITLDEEEKSSKVYALDLGPISTHEQPNYQREVVNELAGREDRDEVILVDHRLLTQYERAQKAGIPYFYVDFHGRQFSVGFTR